MPILVLVLALSLGTIEPVEYASFDYVCYTDKECLELYDGIPCYGDEENLLDTSVCE